MAELFVTATGRWLSFSDFSWMTASSMAGVYPPPSVWSSNTSDFPLPFVLTIHVIKLPQYKILTTLKPSNFTVRFFGQGPAKVCNNLQLDLLGTTDAKYYRLLTAAPPPNTLKEQMGPDMLLLHVVSGTLKTDVSVLVSS
jgi:hypothetical protein